MSVTAVFKLLLVFGDLGSSGALASFELSLELRDESVESILELLLSFGMGLVGTVKAGNELSVVGSTFSAGSDKKIILHLVKSSKLNGGKVSAAQENCIQFPL